MSEAMKARINPRNTRYLGEVHDPDNRQISRIFKAADICSIPGHVGLGLNQAFYWGLPMVTEEGGQPPEVAYLVNGRNGFMVPANDVKALREKIRQLDEEQAQLHAVHGRTEGRRGILQRCPVATHEDEGVAVERRQVDDLLLDPRRELLCGGPLVRPDAGSRAVADVVRAVGEQDLLVARPPHAIDKEPRRDRDRPRQHPRARSEPSPLAMDAQEGVLDQVLDE